MASRYLVEESDLDKVVGGLFVFHKKTMILDYTRNDGSVVYYKILDIDKAWKLCKTLEIDFTPEDKIIAEMIYKGYIEA